VKLNGNTTKLQVGFRNKAQKKLAGEINRTKKDAQGQTKRGVGNKIGPKIKKRGGREYTMVGDKKKRGG